MGTQDVRVTEFRRLHESGCFVMPNPWDAGSARALQRLGFPALATTSAGFAWTVGRPDAHVDLEPVLEHLRSVAAAVDVPVNADFEGGYAVEPEQVGHHVRLAAATGIAGLSIEDSTGDPTDPLHDLDLAVERVGRIDSVEQIEVIVAAVTPKPVNLLANAPFITVREAAELGVRRISVGGTLARTAWQGFLGAAQEIAEKGTFSRFQQLPDVDALLGS